MEKKRQYGNEIEGSAQQICSSTYPEDGACVYRCESEQEAGEDPGPSASAQKAAGQETDEDCVEGMEKNIGGVIPRWTGFP
jgi:hypothetical protein